MPVAHWKSSLTTLTVSPQTGGGTGNTTCDGRVGRQAVDQTFSNIRSGAGTANSETDTILSPYLHASATTGQYQTLRRVGLTFDTSSIPSAANILSVTLRLYGQNKLANIGQLGIVVCAFSPQAANDFVNSDYDLARWPSTEYARISYSAWIVDDWNNITLPVGVVNKGGITNIGLRNTADFDNSTSGISWSASAISGIYFYAADNGSNIPQLVVEYEL